MTLQSNYVREFVNKALEAIQNLIQTIQKVFRNLFESMSTTFKRFKTTFEETLKPKNRTYPHTFPQYVNKSKFYNLDKRGFPRPIMRCARSRC